MSASASELFSNIIDFHINEVIERMKANEPLRKEDKEDGVVSQTTIDKLHDVIGKYKKNVGGGCSKSL